LRARAFNESVPQPTTQSRQAFEAERSVANASEEERALTRGEHRRLAEVLLRAARDRRPIKSLAGQYPEMTMADAGGIRDMAIVLRVAGGQRLAGAKVAYLDKPRIGWLTDGMIQSSPAVDVAALIRPRVEAKLVLTLAAPIDVPVKSVTELLDVTGQVHPGLEILDSRYEDLDLDARDAVADNCSAATLVIGAGAPPVSASALTRITGQIEVSSSKRLPTRLTLAASAAWLKSVLWLVGRVVEERGRLEAGTLLATPGLNDPAYMGPNARVRAAFAGIGSASIEAGDGSCR
jgi:2-keto-4-pentenoate hydratase